MTKEKTFPSKSTGKSYAEAVASCCNDSTVNSVTSLEFNSSALSAIPLMRSRPIGLLNRLENICFLNSVVQVLYLYQDYRLKFINLIQEHL